MSALRPGDIVDITIKGVQVDAEGPDGTVTIIAEHPDGGTAHWHMPPQAAIERIAPAEWPPRTGDLWRDRDGDVWLCVTWTAYNETHTGLACTRRVPGKVGMLGGSLSPQRVADQHGPLTLVHREETS